MLLGLVFAVGMEVWSLCRWVGISSGKPRGNPQGEQENLSREVNQTQDPEAVRQQHYQLDHLQYCSSLGLFFCAQTITSCFTEERDRASQPLDSS